MPLARHSRPPPPAEVATTVITAPANAQERSIPRTNDGSHAREAEAAGSAASPPKPRAGTTLCLANFFDRAAHVPSLLGRNFSPVMRDAAVHMAGMRA